MLIKAREKLKGKRIKIKEKRQKINDQNIWVWLIMKKFLLIFSIFYIILGCGSHSSFKKEIIGYYPSFRYLKNRKIEDPSLIPFEKLTIINYAFFAPDSSAELKGLDPEADSILLSGKGSHSIISLAHKKRVKVLASIGGWEDSGLFSFIAAGSSLTSKFASECTRIIKQYGFDGIDIDWEYPCYKPHNGKPEDKENFTSFLSVIRDSLNALGRQNKNHYLLTAALPATREHSAGIDVNKVSKILDFLNIMTYDYHGTWDTVSAHNSPLYAPDKGDKSLCIDSTVKMYHSELGVPLNKINIGLPFYGHTYANCKGLFEPHTGPDTLVFNEDFGAVYRNIVTNMHLFDRHLDKKAKVPYLTGKEFDLFVSYDDSESVKEKCDYVVKNRLRGVIIWEVTGTIMQDNSTPLLDVIYEKFNK